MAGYLNIPEADSALGGTSVAAIPEADLSFDTVAGHDHDGVDSKLISSAGDMTKAVYDADADSMIDAAAGGTDWDSSAQTGFPYITVGVWSAVTKGIANGNVLTADQADAADNDIAKFTANGIEGRSYTELKADIDLEIGTDVLAQQTIGIADNNLLEVDDAAAADDDFARFTASGIEGISAQTALSALLAQVLLENDSIKLDPALSADGKWNGITETGTASVTLAFGDLVYLITATSKWGLAKADVAATSSGKIGICVLAALNADDPTNVLLWGKVNAAAAFPVLTIGAPVFVSAATAGDVVTTAPSGTTNFVVRIIGYGNTADELYFAPDNTYLELA